MPASSLRASQPGRALYSEKRETVRVDLDTEIERLYGVGLEEFVPVRTELVRALKKDGLRAEAARVQELKKPPLVVWAVNQVARTERKQLELLLDAGERLGAAQKALLTGGDTKPFDKARAQEQAALSRLRAGARKILGERASAGTLDRVVSTLRSAAVSDARDALARGCLAAEVAPVGFEAFSGLGPLPEAAPPRTTATHVERRRGAKGTAPASRDDRPEREAARKKAIETARSEVKAAGEREADVARELREARRAAKDARKLLETAEAKVERLEERCEAAAAEVEAAQDRLKSARLPA
jgi:hypothetical protein